jgi:uncharacterized protein
MPANQQEKACAICGRPQVERFIPFCSRRCADVDLHRWLSGSYAIPVVEDEPEESAKDRNAEGDRDDVERGS